MVVLVILLVLNRVTTNNNKLATCGNRTFQQKCEAILDPIWLPIVVRRSAF